MGFMRVPNLELVLYKAQQLLAHDTKFVDALKEKRKTEKHLHIDFSLDVFPQMWGSTCAGSDVTENGEPTIGGSVMTEEYTVVIHERTTDSYCVFFGEQPCYKVTNANADFYDDLKNHRMASLSEAKQRY